MEDSLIYSLGTIVTSLYITYSNIENKIKNDTTETRKAEMLVFFCI